MYDDGFNIPPPEPGEGVPINYDTPTSLDAAWTKYIMEFELPKDLENILLSYTLPVVNLAPKANIMRREINIHLDAYDLIWQRYKIFLRKGRFEPRLYVIKEIIRHALELQLTRGIEGWQGNLLFTRKYEIMQEQKEKRKRGISQILSRKKKNPEPQTGDY